MPRTDVSIGKLAVTVSYSDGVEIQILLKDSTGQSRLVDEYLGPPGSPGRKRAAAAFRKMQSSLNSCRSATDLDNLFV